MTLSQIREMRLWPLAPVPAQPHPLNPTKLRWEVGAWDQLMGRTQTSWGLRNNTELYPRSRLPPKLPLPAASPSCIPSILSISSKAARPPGDPSPP